ncbi:MAG TPA: hypothetical protein VIC57_07590 [Candidatus Dormibacteraeota bacterium]|jgi:hypothetical protein
MPENRPFKRLARQAAAAAGEPYAAAAERLRAEPAYVAGYGFRPALAGFQAAGVVTASGRAGTAAVTRVLGSADRTEVEVDVELAAGAEVEISPSMRGPEVRASLAAGRWTAEVGRVELSHDRRRARLWLTFPPVPSRVRALTLRLEGDLGAWEARVPVKPLGGVARRSEAAAGGGQVTRLGVTLEVTGVVFDRNRTAVRIAASAAEPIRFIRGIGTELGNRRPPGRELVLVDGLGGAHREVWDGEARPDPAGREHVVVFPAVDPAARSLSLEVPCVGVEERGDGVEVDVPVRPATVALGRYRMELLGSEPAEGAAARFYPLRVRFRWLAAPASRRPLRPGQVFVDGRGAAHSGQWLGPAAFVDVQVADPPARRIRLAFPRVLVTGPWRLTFRRP